MENMKKQTKSLHESIKPFRLFYLCFQISLINWLIDFVTMKVISAATSDLQKTRK